jgi:hypothetical protein
LNFSELRTAHKPVRKQFRQQSRLVFELQAREERLREAAVLAAHERLPEGAAKALMDVARKRTDLSLDDALATVSSVLEGER